MNCIKYSLYMLVVLSIVFSFMTINGCGGDDDESLADGDYWPCAIGNIWNYVYTMTVTTPETTATVTGSITIEIVGDTLLINNQPVLMQEYAVTMFGNTEIDTYYIADTDASILRYNSLYDTIPDVMLELPLEVGNTWVVSGYTAAVVLDRENIAVPAGAYYGCFEVAYTAYDDTVYDYYAANTGIVKEYMSDIEGDWAIFVTVELESAVIN